MVDYDELLTRFRIEISNDARGPIASIINSVYAAIEEKGGSIVDTMRELDEVI